jgi:hypothetical protein
LRRGARFYEKYSLNQRPAFPIGPQMFDSQHKVHVFHYVPHAQFFFFKDKGRRIFPPHWGW